TDLDRCRGIWAEPCGFEELASLALHTLGVAARMLPAETLQDEVMDEPGVMVEAYLRNATLRMSLFIRYGSGHPRSLAAAIRLYAEMLVSGLVSRTNHTPRPTLVAGP